MEFRVLIHSQDAQLFLLLQHILAAEGFLASLTDRMEQTASDVRAIIVDCSQFGSDPGRLRAVSEAFRKTAVVLLLNGTAGMAPAIGELARADLVLGRPFDPALLIRFLLRMRLDALLGVSRLASADRVLRFCDIELNTETVRVRRNGHHVALTALQFRLLHYLMRHPATVLSREQLIEAGWPLDADVEPRTVDIHMGHIRRALRTFGPNLIRTVRKIGYTLDVPPASC